MKIPKLNLKYLIIILLSCLVLAIMNNLISSESKSVTWFGGQEVFEKPEGY